MLQEQVGAKRMPGISIVAAFGLLTMSSSIAGNSSMFSRQAVGDIVSIKKRSYLVQQHENINVNLQITKITKHISSFEFEEEYEEI